MFWKGYKPSNFWHKSSFNYLGFEGKFHLWTRLATFPNAVLPFQFYLKRPAVIGNTPDITVVKQALWS